jgi:hypothetical protein
MRRLALVVITLTARAAAAQMDHAAHAAAAGATPTAAPGQAAYAAIADVVRALEADPKTDWSRVNIAALRQHLVDMDEVTLHSTTAERTVEGGLVADVTGDTPRAAAAVGRMVRAHTAALDAEPRFAASAEPLPSGGVRLTVRARDPRDTALVARIRGLGFYGLLTVGDHHAAHHLMLARGEKH